MPKTRRKKSARRSVSCVKKAKRLTKAQREARQNMLNVERVLFRSAMTNARKGFLEKPYDKQGLAGLIQHTSPLQKCSPEENARLNSLYRSAPYRPSALVRLRLFIRRIGDAVDSFWRRRG